jgi:hypothetical protein
MAITRNHFHTWGSGKAAHRLGVTTTAEVQGTELQSNLLRILSGVIGVAGF